MCRDKNAFKTLNIGKKVLPLQHNFFDNWQKLKR